MTQAEYEDTMELLDAQATEEAGAREMRQYSLLQFEDGKRFVDVDVDQHLFDGLSVDEMGRVATRIIRERFKGVIGSINRAFVNGRTASEYNFLQKETTHQILGRRNTEPLLNWIIFSTQAMTKNYLNI